MFASLVSYSQKPFGSLLVAYVMGITGLIIVIAMLAATVAHQVITSFEPSLGGKSSAVSSRVEAGLEIQARTASWKPDEHVVAPPHIIELALSASALAFGMDRAESAEGEFSAVKASGPPESAFIRRVRSGRDNCSYSTACAGNHAADETSLGHCRLEAQGDCSQS